MRGQQELSIKTDTLKVLNFTILAFFDHFCKILYRRKVSKPQNREIRYLQNQISSDIEILFFLILNQSMILIPVYRISLLIIKKLELL